MTQAFLRLLGPTKRGTVVNVNSGAAFVVIPGTSGYSTSKLAMTHLARFVAAEHPNVTAVVVSPGIIETDMTKDYFRRFAKDTPALIGGCCVWLATDKARFLSGRYIAAHWSVEELMLRADEIVDEDKLVTGLNVKLGKDHIQ